MAALDTPLMTTLSPNSTISASSPTNASSSNPANPPPTYAAFSPTPSSHTKHHARTTLLVHQKSPLLVATPPQITRALAYSHPFISPLSKLAGLLSWSTNDPWESFLLVALFWAIVLYGDFILRTSGPLLLGAALILGMYSRRFSPLSSTGWATPQPPRQPTGDMTPPSRPRKETHGATAHHKSLDEIVHTLQTFTTRCNILLDPFLALTDFLSTQHTATTATTRPALTALFVRLLMLAPIWWALTLPPLRLITTRRAVLTIGTLALSWHSRPARVSRVIFWRSRSVRRAACFITGLDFALSSTTTTSTAREADKTAAAAAAAAVKLAAQPGKQAPSIRFTFALYENQRRWLGIGWTHSMLAPERAPWTDEYLNPAPPKESFELPEVPGGMARWRWCEHSSWEVAEDSNRGEREAGARKQAASGAKHADREESEDEWGWIYYDNKWQNGRRGVDGWGRYTRRRKWVRDAELVEMTPSGEATPRVEAEGKDDVGALPALDGEGGLLAPGGTGHVRGKESVDSNSSVEGKPEKEKSSWFRRRKEKNRSREVSETASVASTTGGASGTSGGGGGVESDDTASEVTKTTERERDDDDGYVPMRQAAWNIGIGDDVAMDLG